jgi:hypothetical protein
MSTKNLYLIEISGPVGYDRYNQAIVCTTSARKAKNIHPNGEKYGDPGWNSYSWVSDPELVYATCIGKAAHNVVVDSVLCASFNAG